MNVKRTLSLIRSVTFYARSSSCSCSCEPNRFPSLVTSTRSRLRLYSSNGNGSNLTQTQKPNSSVDVENVSNQELKKLIEKFYAGDEEAIPSIFEAILKRKLAGNSDEADKELMEEIVGKNRELLDDIDDEEFESDLDEVCDTDENIVELRNAKETLMKRKVRDE